MNNAHLSDSELVALDRVASLPTNVGRLLPGNGPRAYENQRAKDVRVMRGKKGRGGSGESEPVSDGATIDTIQRLLTTTPSSEDVLLLRDSIRRR